MNDKKLYKSPLKKLCGVCGGLGDYFGVDPTVIRIGVVLLAVYTAVVPVLICYFIVAAIIPSAPENYYDYFVNNNIKKLTKGVDKTICGVCSGIAQYFGIDVTIVRIVMVFLVLFLGTGLFAYIVCAILMPNSNAYYDENYQNQNGGFNGNATYNS